MSQYRVAKNATLTRRKQRFEAGTIIPIGSIPASEIAVFLENGMIEKIETVKPDSEIKLRNHK
jgi:hypothetical protein